MIKLKKDKKLKSLYSCLENVVKSYDDLRNTSNGKSDFETNIEMATKDIPVEFWNAMRDKSLL